jgi:hypothetical protein
MGCAVAFWENSSQHGRLLMRRATAVIAVLFASFLPATARAVSLPVTNAGFELPVAVNGQFVHSVGPGWVASEELGSDAGVMNPAVALFPSEAPEGSNVVNLSRGGRIDQILSDVLTPGDYTLTMQVGRSVNEPMSPFIIHLLAAGVSLVQTSTASPAAGTFTLVTLNYSATDSDPNLGNPLAIRIDLTGGTSSLPQFYADDVQLEYLPVPEPSSLVLAAIGLVGMFFGLRRRARR